VRERVGVRASLNQRLKNALKNHLRLRKHVIVPEPQNTKTRTRQIESPLDILACVYQMLSPIELDDQTRTQADEVDDVTTQRHLATEPVSSELSVAHEAPETAFGVARICAQGACIGEE